MANRALLFGINRYQVPGSDLRGCVNDVENMASVLTDLYGFPKSGIKRVTDLKATTERIRTGIEGFVRGARRGDVLLLHYSGHGSNVPDKNGDEADYRDEILCPTDLSWYDPLTDDWLRAVLDGLPSGVNLTVVMDCCHSGSNTRAIHPPDAKVIERFLPCPLDLMAAESGRSLRGRTRGRRRGRTRGARGGSRGVRTTRRKTATRPDLEVKVVDIPETLISGCRADQTSADAHIRGTYHGAMSYSLVRAIRHKRGRAAATYRELHAEMLGWLDGKYEQVPQLEGREENLDRPFLEPL